jgi:hypothetical protein
VPVAWHDRAAGCGWTTALLALLKGIVDVVAAAVAMPAAVRARATAYAAIVVGRSVMSRRRSVMPRMFSGAGDGSARRGDPAGEDHESAGQRDRRTDPGEADEPHERYSVSA